MQKTNSRVLIVDDDREYVQVVNAILMNSEQNLKIENSYTGQEALKKIYDNPPDLIICDLALPDMNGSEICFKIKNDPALHFIPILVVTGADYTNKMKLQLLEAGAEAFLTKPFGESELIAYVRSLLRLKSAEDEIRIERDRLKQEVQLKERHINHQKERMEIIYSQIIEGIWEWNLEDNSIFLSSKAKTMLGYSKEDLSIKTFEDFMELVCPADQDRFRKEINAYVEQETDVFKSEIRMCYADGSYRWFLFHGYGVWDRNYKPLRIVGIKSDITESKENQRSLERIALEDYVTRLPNRILFYKLVEKELGQARRNKTLLGFIFIDLDNFKQINDDYGHQTGDMVLKAVADRISQNMRPLDVLARFAGDEFIGSLVGIHEKAEIAIVINRLKSLFNKPVDIDGQHFTIRFSAGGSVYPTDGESIDALLKIADERMFEDKKKNKKGAPKSADL